jgi:hypothetical protein
MQTISQKIPARTISWIILGVWSVYIITAPFYIFPKGRPQPADFILITAILPFLFTQFIATKTKITPAYLVGGLFVFMTIIINFINHLFFPDIRLLLTMLYYPYNFMIFVFLSTLCRHDAETFKKTTYWAIVISVTIQLIVMLFFEGAYRGHRATGGFENPNQFAYWSLLTATMIVFLRRGETLKPFDYLLLFTLGYFQTLALSKAGIIAFTTLITLLFFTPKVTKTARALFIAALLCAGSYALYDTSAATRLYNTIDPLKNAAKRIGAIGEEQDDSAEARGYYRLVEYPHYTLLGAGEGAFRRFPDDKGYVRELHSGIATIIFSYGIFGALVFFSFLILIMNRQPLHYILLFLPIILFGLPHQNFRFSDFWALLGINYGLAISMREEKYQNLPPETLEIRSNHAAH